MVLLLEKKPEKNDSDNKNRRVSKAENVLNLEAGGRRGWKGVREGRGKHAHLPVITITMIIQKKMITGLNWIVRKNERETHTHTHTHTLTHLHTHTLTHTHAGGPKGNKKRPKKTFQRRSRRDVVPLFISFASLPRSCQMTTFTGKPSDGKMAAGACCSFPREMAPPAIPLPPSPRERERENPQPKLNPYVKCLENGIRFEKYRINGLFSFLVFGNDL